MSSVTGRINEITQPQGGYIKPSQFQEISFTDNAILKDENLHHSIIGLVVDYLTRFIMGADVEKAFEISSIGYSKRIEILTFQNPDIPCEDAQKGIDVYSLFDQIKGLDDLSIISACKACTYDAWYRNPWGALHARGAEETNPDKDTIENIKTMVYRSILFWEKYGPITTDGFDFGKNGYTATVTTGEGDYLSSDTIWDFKVSKSKPTSKNTLQLAMYWIMGQHSGK